MCSFEKVIVKKVFKLLCGTDFFLDLYKLCKSFFKSSFVHTLLEFCNSFCAQSLWLAGIYVYIYMLKLFTHYQFNLF